jgi:hypothetical protein
MPYSCCTIALEKQALNHYGKALGCSSQGDALDTLVRSILPGIQQSVNTVHRIVIRTEPSPAVGVIGEFEALDIAHLKLQLRSLNLTCQRLKYVDMDNAIAIGERLAEQFVGNYGSDLHQFGFMGIPRGGLIVLGFLSYQLGLKTSQLTSPFSEQLPLVMVDDCVLSGARISSCLQQQHHPKIIVAVLACLSGDDLVDHGSTLMGTRYGTWQQQNRQRIEGTRYWIGLPDYLCFPWNEPDYLLWNSHSQTYEKSWRIVPPQRCLKNRPQESALSLTVIHQPFFPGHIQPTADIVFAEVEETIVIGQLSTGATYCLQNPATTQWQKILTSQWTSEADFKDADPTLHAFFRELSDKGILSFTPAPQS